MTDTELDAESARCAVLTYREGLLSAVGHDLELGVERFTLSVRPDLSGVEGCFDPSSLRVVATRKGDRTGPPLPPRDARHVERTARRMLSEGGPIRFRSEEVIPTGDGWRIRGALTLNGVTAPLTAVARRAGAHVVARARVHQPDFGIAPYRALLGALVVRPDVDVELRVPLVRLPHAG
ncbi:MAG: YceI family protein [Sandaracinaceae bacterium]